MKLSREALLGTALLGGSLTGGALGASLVGTAGAQTGTSSTTPTADAPDPSQGGHTANGVTETLLTGDTASQVTAAAQGAVPGATIDRVETDAEGAADETHMRRRPTARRSR